MPPLKLVLWNMEWLNDLFVRDGGGAQFRPDDEHPQHAKETTVRIRRNHLSGVLNLLGPDIVVVVEGPNQNAELQLFFDSDVQGSWKTHLQESGNQSIGIAVRTDLGKFQDPPLVPKDTGKDDRFAPFLVDTDSDDIKEQHKFERRPLYTEVRPASGKAFHVFGLHLKSKGIFEAYEWSRWWEKADANRKKILAQASQIRDRFIDPYLKDPETSEIPLIVCGDINDGPGLDASEKRLFGSGIERLMGTVWKPALCLGNALFERLKPGEQERLDFSDNHTTSFKDPIFNATYQKEWIDHILYSKNVPAQWVTNPQIHRILPDGKPIWVNFKQASDHFPVSVELTT